MTDPQPTQNQITVRYTIACGLLLIQLTGCGTTAGYETVLQTWVGDSSDHLVSVWGVPQRSYKQRGGGSVLEYERTGQFVLPGVTTYQAQTTYTNGTVSGIGSDGRYVNGSYDGTATTYVPLTSAPTIVQKRCVTRFTVGPNGRITNWAWEGNSCKAVKPKQSISQAPDTSIASAPAPAPTYQKCTADQLRHGGCS